MLSIVKISDDELATLMKSADWPLLKFLVNQIKTLYRNYN